MSKRPNRNLPWVWNPPCWGLYVNVTCHEGEGTKGYANYWHVEGHRAMETPLVVKYTSDAQLASLEALEDVLQTMLKQIHRQREMLLAVE